MSLPKSMQVSNITTHIVRKIKPVEYVEKHLLHQMKSDFCSMKMKGRRCSSGRKSKKHLKGFVPFLTHSKDFALIEVLSFPSIIRPPLSLTKFAFGLGSQVVSDFFLFYLLFFFLFPLLLIPYVTI